MFFHSKNMRCRHVSSVGPVIFLWWGSFCCSVSNECIFIHPTPDGGGFHFSGGLLVGPFSFIWCISFGGFCWWYVSWPDMSVFLLVPLALYLFLCVGVFLFGGSVSTVDLFRSTVFVFSWWKVVWRLTNARIWETGMCLWWDSFMNYGVFVVRNYCVVSCQLSVLCVFLHRALLLCGGASLLCWLVLSFWLVYDGWVCRWWQILTRSTSLLA